MPAMTFLSSLSFLDVCLGGLDLVAVTQVVQKLAYPPTTLSLFTDFDVR